MFDDITTQDQARDAAIQWQSEFSDRTLSWGELAEEQAQLETLARRFNLMDEFRENGIL